MTSLEPADLLKDMKVRLEQVTGVLNPSRINTEITELEELAAKPGLWDDQEAAQRITFSLSQKKLLLNRLETIESGLEDAAVLLELSEQERDSRALSEAQAELADLANQLSGLETETLLSGEYDSRSAIMSIRSGASVSHEVQVRSVPRGARTGVPVVEFLGVSMVLSALPPRVNLRAGSQNGAPAGTDRDRRVSASGRPSEEGRRRSRRSSDRIAVNGRRRPEAADPSLRWWAEFTQSGRGPATECGRSRRAAPGGGAGRRTDRIPAESVVFRPSPW